MNLDTILGVSFLAIAIIGYVASRLIQNVRFKYVDQRVKDRGETDYVIVLYI